MRLTLKLKRTHVERLEELQEIHGLDSKTDVIRKAISLYDFMTAAKAKGLTPAMTNKHRDYEFDIELTPRKKTNAQ